MSQNFKQLQLIQKISSDPLFWPMLRAAKIATYFLVIGIVLNMAATYIAS